MLKPFPHFAERRGLPSGPFHCGYFDHHLLDIRPPVVRGSYSVIHQSCEVLDTGIRKLSSRRETSVPWNQVIYSEGIFSAIWILVNVRVISMFSYGNWVLNSKKSALKVKIHDKEDRLRKSDSKTMVFVA